MTCLNNIRDDQEMLRFGLDKMPYDVFTLKHNPEKTDPKYYNILLNHFGLNPESVVYFEHNEMAVKSARTAGINTYYYDPEKKDLIALKQFLDESLSY